jgi:hypothetical protein
MLTGPIEPAGREWTESGHVGHLGMQSRPMDSTSSHAGEEAGRHPPRGTLAPFFSASALLSSLFALSQLQLKPFILKSYFFDSESIS